ncbi:MAG: peptide chain release factor N(5)-glutamine methyltransferase [Oscillochloris sp.]|nr:peptide chain release factor N(5)-glutamine methyltransferase [Oscillochloris sp.]
MNVASLLKSAVDRLSSISTTPRLDAELLLAHVLAWPRARLLAERDYQPDSAAQAAFARAVERRASLEPVAYIVGKREFYGLELVVDRRVLVPRPETELLVELAIAEARRFQHASGHLLRIADIGTGSGAVAIAIARHLPQARIYAVDLSLDALAVATLNVRQHNLHDRVSLLHGDLLKPLPEPVDLLVSNPPYTVLAEVEPNVRAHEPWLALEGGPDGAAIYRRLLSSITSALRSQGGIVLEIGSWQAELVSGLIQAALPAAQITVYQDLAGRDRVVVARQS